MKFMSCTFTDPSVKPDEIKFVMWEHTRSGNNVFHGHTSKALQTKIVSLDLASLRKYKSAQ